MYMPVLCKIHIRLKFVLESVLTILLQVLED